MTGDASENEAATPVETISTAKARVFNTPELLDLILSHLPASDLFNMAEVDRKHRAGVHKSLAARRTLFLSERPGLPGTWSLVRYKPYPDKDWFTQAIELSSDVPRPEYVENITPVEVCPLLNRFGNYFIYEEQACPEDLYLGHGHSAGFRMMSKHRDFILPLLAEMMITNPPCHDVFVTLAYKHKGKALALLQAQRAVHGDSALTLKQVLQDAFEQRGDVLTRALSTGLEPAVQIPPSRTKLLLKGRSVGDVSSCASGRRISAFSI